MKNKQIAEIFNRIGLLLEMKNDNVFKIRSYYKAAETLETLPEDVETLKNENRLTEIPGFGVALRDKVIEYLQTGKIDYYAELIKEIPESLLELVTVPSIGPKKAKLFYDTLGVKNIDELQKAVEAGKLVGLPGIKDKAIENIINGIKIVRQGQERMHLGTASRVAEEVMDALKKLKEVKQIAPAGSLRRGRETIRDIDILVDSTNPKKVMDTFVGLPQVKKISNHGETKSTILTTDNVQVDLRVVEPKSWGAALLYFTGSKNFNVKIRQIAIKKNMKVNEYGIFRVSAAAEKLVASKTEEECLKILDLPYIPPELREDIGETELFSGKKLPRLIELKDIKGELHVHSTWSDGRNTIKDMAEAARKRGYEYLAISDHSARLKIASGLSPEALKAKKKEIDALNSKYKDFRILFGTEVEIDNDGNPDYNEKILSEFDVVVASVHTGFEQSSEQLTRRIVRACQNKHVDIIGHPTGVHLGKRDAYNLDLKEVCKAAADTNTCLEINSFPIRLDLNSSNVYFARSQGVKFAINTDAHAMEHLEYMKFGITVARRGWLTKQDVLNTLSLKELLGKLKR